MKRLIIIVLIALAIVNDLAFAAPYSIDQRLKQFGQISRNRWKPYFNKVKISYPPKKLVFLGLKAERTLEVYAENKEGQLKFIRSIPICAQSGRSGPKLREGDGQVPEGIYGIALLNPNSSFHLSMRINYPNSFDRKKALLDKRSQLGGDIMIHGNCVSIGCLAMRDEPAEDLFVLAADSKISNIKVILAPFDSRKRSFTKEDLRGLPLWTDELYRSIHNEIIKLPTDKS